MGTRQLTLCPSSTNFREPSLNLTKIGVIPTGGSPGQGKVNGAQDRRQDLAPISEWTTWNWVWTPHGQRDMGPPIDDTGGPNWGPKGGSFLLLEMSQDWGCPQWYISTPAWRSDPPFHMQFTRIPTETHMYLALKDLHGPRLGDDPNWVRNCQNGKIGRLGRPVRVGILGDLVVPSLDSRPLISPLVPCPGLWFAVPLAAYCSPRDDHTDGAESNMRCKGGDHGSHQKLNNSR